MDLHEFIHDIGILQAHVEGYTVGDAMDYLAHNGLDIHDAMHVITCTFSEFEVAAHVAKLSSGHTHLCNHCRTHYVCTWPFDRNACTELNEYMNYCYNCSELDPRS